MRAPDLPFECRLELPMDLTTGRVVVAMELATPRDGTQVWSCEESVELVLQGIESQVLNDRAQAREERCTVSRRSKSDSRIAFELMAAEVSGMTWLVLLSLLTQGHFGGEPLRFVSIEATGDGASRPLSEWTAALPTSAQMPAFRASPFPVVEPGEWGGGPNSATYRFGRALSGDEFLDLKFRLEVWAGIAHLGGFLFDFREQADFDPDFGRVHQQTPTRCDFVWNDFEGWGLAFRGLVNVAAALQRKGLPVASLTLI